MMSHNRDPLNDLNELAQLQPDVLATKRAVERAQAALGALPNVSVAQETARGNWNAKLWRNVLIAGAAVVLLALVAQSFLTRSDSNFAFAQVQEQVAKTTSLQYTEQSGRKMPDGSAWPIGHVKILGGRVERKEMETDQPMSMFLGPFGPSIEITDLDKKKRATLYPQIKGYQLMDWGGTFVGAYIPATPEAQKKLEQQVTKALSEQKKHLPKELRDKITAVAVPGPMDFSASKPVTQLDVYELVRNVPTDRAQRQGEKVINGKRTVEFVVEQDEERFGKTVKWRHTWWVDPETKLPVQLEIASGSDVPRDGGYKTMIRDIVFNEPVDPALFSIDLPPGYTDLKPLFKSPEEIQELLKKPNRTITMQFSVTENYKSADGKRAPELVKQVKLLDMTLERDEVTFSAADPATTNPAATLLPEGMEPNIRIRDGKRNKVIVLLPEKQQYLNPVHSDFASDYVDLVKKQEGQTRPARGATAQALLNPPTNVKFMRLPLKTIDGQVAFGQHFVEETKRDEYVDTREGTLWNTFSSMETVEGEFSLRSTDPSVGQVDYVVHDFVYYKPVDRDLFDLTPPAGYAEIETPAPAKPAADAEKSDK